MTVQRSRPATMGMEPDLSVTKRTGRRMASCESKRSVGRGNLELLEPPRLAAAKKAMSVGTMTIMAPAVQIMNNHGQEGGWGCWLAASELIVAMLGGPHSVEPTVKKSASSVAMGDMGRTLSPANGAVVVGCPWAGVLVLSRWTEAFSGKTAKLAWGNTHCNTGNSSRPNMAEVQIR